MLYQIIGIDPGIVHTGLVGIDIYTRSKEIQVRHLVIAGVNGHEANLWVNSVRASNNINVFQEKYQPRGSLNHNVEMVKAEQDYQKATRSRLILNTGVKKIVRRPLMELLGCWSFATPTHHQDLRSAARIGIYGALKDDHLNTILAGIVSDHLNKETWDVTHH